MKDYRLSGIVRHCEYMHSKDSTGFDACIICKGDNPEIYEFCNHLDGYPFEWDIEEEVKEEKQCRKFSEVFQYYTKNDIRFPYKEEIISDSGVHLWAVLFRTNKNEIQVQMFHIEEGADILISLLERGWRPSECID